MSQLLKIKVVPRAKQEKIVRQPDGSFKVWVNAIPEKGRANRRVLELLAGFFGKSKSQIAIVKGEVSPQKTIIIN